MRISILSDSNWEAKIDHATRTLTTSRHFEGRKYGSGLLGLSIILNARNPDLGHRRRERFSKTAKILYFDIMLDLDEMIRSSHQRRRDIICEAVCTETATILRKRRFSDFDMDMFLHDFESRIRDDLQGDGASRFDHLSLVRATGT